jgi:ATP-binding cassette subfamily F protein 3
MALVSAHNLAKSFGAVDIFDNVTVSIPHGARIALVGPNGAGKTTLLRLLAKVDKPSDGTVSHLRDLRIGFLQQEADLALSGGTTLWYEMLLVFAGVIEEEARLAALAEELERYPEDAALLEAYGEAQQRFETGGGYDYPTRIKQVLGGLGFDETDYDRPVEQFSGGQKTRALLARLLLEHPDLLILDEPTNHLDIRAIEWLEGFLRNFDGALLLVSHDRYFMDSVVEHIWEMMHGRVEEYRGNYTAYLEQREARWERAEKLYEQEKERMLQDVDFIKRNMASRGTSQAIGRLKRLTRQLIAIEELGLVNALNAKSWAQLDLHNERPFSVEEAERRVRGLSKPVRPLKELHLNLQARRRSGDKVLMTRGLVLGYHDDGVPLFEAPDITLYRSECAALIGPNGAGKSTFLRTVLGQLEPLAGEAKLGASVEIGYFAQAHEGLQPDHTILDEILTLRNMPIGEARSYLGSFLFSGEDVYKPISALSGGERGRVALAKLALSGANLLLLDEPTNHLDIPAQEVLEAVLAGFEGTILLVSHDRYLIRDLATQIWALHTPRKASDGRTELVVFEGPYDEYLAWRDNRTAPAAKSKPEKKEPPPAAPPKIAEPARPTLNPYQRRQRLHQVEDEIHRLEVEMVNLSGALEVASSAGNVNEVGRLGQAYSTAQSRIDALMLEWEELLTEA